MCVLCFSWFLICWVHINCWNTLFCHNQNFIVYDVYSCAALYTTLESPSVWVWLGKDYTLPGTCLHTSSIPSFASISKGAQFSTSRWKCALPPPMNLTERPLLGQNFMWLCAALRLHSNFCEDNNVMYFFVLLIMQILQTYSLRTKSWTNSDKYKYFPIRWQKITRR